MSPARAVERVADGLLVVTAASLTLSITGMQIGIGGLFGLALLAPLLGVRVVSWTPFDGPLALLGGTLLLSTLASGHPSEAAGWSRLWVVIGYFGVYWWLRDEARVARVWRVFVVTAIAVALYGIVQHYTGIDWYRDLMGRPRQVAPRVAGGQGYAVVGFFSSYLTFGHAMILPLGGLIAAAVQGTGGAMVGAGVVVTALAFSTARGAWIAVGVMVVVAGFMAPSRRTLWRLGALVALGTVVLAGSPALRAQVPPLLSLGGINAHRVAIYRANLDIVADHPVLGLGFGRYRRAAKPYYEPYPQADRRSHAHNDILQIAAEAGLLGVVAFTFLFAFVLRAAVEAMRDPGVTRVRLFGCTLAVVGFFVGGMTQYNFGDNEVACSLWFTLAVLARSLPRRST